MEAIFLLVLAAQEWTQDGHDAQRTGYSPEEPVPPWTPAWTWNGPDAQGGTGGHFYHQPQAHVPWEARTCTGGRHVYVPAGSRGLYALRKTDGGVGWRFDGASFQTTPAYDPAGAAVFAGAESGVLYKFRASDGGILGTYDAGGKIVKPVLWAGGAAYVLTERGELHKVDGATMTRAWVYSAGSAPQTLAAYSGSRKLAIFATADLYVHAVRETDGARAWRVKPTTLSPGTHVEFTGGWPVVADGRGIVFVRMLVGDINGTLWTGGGSGGKWPRTNADIRRRLVENPQYRNLFALGLDDGREAFVPAVGPSGVEDLLSDGSPRLRVHNFPVVRRVGDRELAYVLWRNGDTRDPNWDGRWDSHLGEMVLDAETVSGYQAGDLRFVQFEEHGFMVRITDEACPLTMAGDTIFHAHWGASEAARITDRSAARGATRADPIRTTRHPVVLRRIQANGSYDPQTHWTTGSLTLYGDPRTWPGPGWWVYWNTLDPPTPARNAYSEGILPRYTYVSDGLVVVEGNGGDLMVFRHSGTAMPSPEGPPPPAPPGPPGSGSGAASPDSEDESDRCGCGFIRSRTERLCFLGAVGAAALLWGFGRGGGSGLWSGPGK
jgi:outer membrane protein assembly factor BamB